MAQHDKKGQNAEGLLSCFNLMPQLRLYWHIPMGFPPGRALFHVLLLRADGVKGGSEPRKTFMSFVLGRFLCAYIFL